MIIHKHLKKSYEKKNESQKPNTNNNIIKIFFLTMYTSQNNEVQYFYMTKLTVKYTTIDTYL